MKPKSVAVLVALALLVPSGALAWGNAAHVWLAQRLGAKGGVSNLHEVYGILLPDQYNFLFDPAGQWLALQAHTDVQPVLDLASNCRLRAAAFGFAAHNDVWGADFTAHHDGRTTPGVGWVVAKAALFAPTLTSILTDFLVASGIAPADAAVLATAMAPEFSHILIESGADLVIRESVDAKVGSRMVASSRVRSPDLPALLATAYAPGLAVVTGMTVENAADYIRAVEEAYRDEVFLYGKALRRPPRRTLQILGTQGAAVAEAYLAAATGLSLEVPPGTVELLVRAAADLVAPDLEAELLATLDYLRAEAAARGVESCWPSK